MHTLAVLPIYFRLVKRIDPLALVISSSIVDLEPFFVLVFGLQQPPHGFWHSYFAMLLLSVPLMFVVYLFESKASRIVERGYKLVRFDSVPVKYPLRTVFLTNVFGGFSHIFFDMFTHRSFAYVLYPMIKFPNPFWMGLEVAMIVEALVILLSAFSLWLWIKSFWKKKATRDKPLTTWNKHIIDNA